MLRISLGNTYQWSTGETHPVLNINQQGNYIVTVTDISGCEKMDSFYVKVEDYFQEKELLHTRIYPNPTTDILMIDYLMQAPMTSLQFEIFDALGKKLLEKKFN